MSRSINLYVAAVLLAMFTTTGCLSAGKRTVRPFVMPEGEKVTLLGQDTWVPNWAVDPDTRLLFAATLGDYTRQKAAALNTVEDNCKLIVHDAHAPDVIVVGSQAVLYALAAGLGVGVGSLAIETTATVLEMFQYGAAAGAGPGAANAVITLAGKSYTLQSCGAAVFDLLPKYGIRVIQTSPW